MFNYVEYVKHYFYVVHQIKGDHNMKKSLFILLILSLVGCEFVENEIVDPSVNYFENQIDNQRYSKSPIESSSKKWTNGIIYYIFHNNVDDRYKEVIRECMLNFENISSLQFIESKNQEYFVTIKRGEKNSVSNTGMHKNLIMLLYNAKDKRTITHELGHVIGLDHEHQREDRNKYVKILWENILKDNYDQYVIIKNGLIPENLFSYDKNSFIHYKEKRSLSGEKIIFIDKDFSPDKDNFFTDKDIKKIQHLYL